MNEINAGQSKIYYSVLSWDVRKDSEKTHVNQAILCKRDFMQPLTKDHSRDIIMYLNIVILCLTASVKLIVVTRSRKGYTIFYLKI